MNRALLGMAPHASKAISDAVRDRPDVVDLTVGVPDFGPPEAVRQALADAARRPALDRYVDAQGLPGLRRTIADRYRRLFGLDVGAEHVLVTNGAAEALWMSVFALTDPGATVLVPDPGYTLYGSVVEALGRRLRRVPTSPASGFKLTPDALEQALDPDVALLVVNSPANPTGTVYTPAELRDIVALAVAHGIYVVHDEVMDDMVWDGAHTSAAAVGAGLTRVVSVNSMSKRFGMTGWRLGWLLAAEDVVRLVTKAHTYAVLATSSVLQAALAECAEDPVVLRQLDERIATVGAHVARAHAQLRAVPGFEGAVARPQGGFYLFADAAAVAPTGQAAAAMFLDRARTAVVPGDAFGEVGRSFVRLSVAGSPEQVSSGIARIATAVADR